MELTNNEITYFCGQMAMILKAGISSMEGVSMLAEDADSEEGRAILKGICSVLEEGGSLHLALERAQVFPKYLLDMTEIGEQSGRLDEVMEALAAYYEREEAISKSIKNAVTYPLIMIGMMVAVILVLIIKVMPIFEQGYSQIGSKRIRREHACSGRRLKPLFHRVSSAAGPPYRLHALFYQKQKRSGQPESFRIPLCPHQVTL